MVAPNPFPGGLTAPQQWLDGLLPALPGATVDAIKHAVLTVARDFYKRSTAWRAWCGPILLNDHQEVYEIESGDVRADVSVVHRVCVPEDDLELRPMRAEAAGPAFGYPVGDKLATYHCPTANQIVFLPLLVEGAARPLVSVYASMVPLDLDIPDFLVQQHYDTICKGVLARMYMVPGLNYKPDLATSIQRQYSAERARARVVAEAGFTPILTVARPPAPFARGMYRGGRQ